MPIRKAYVIGRGAVGLLYATMIWENVGPGSVAFVMDDERYARHESDVVRVNGRRSEVPVLRASEAEPADAVILAIKAPGMEVALQTMERVVGPHTRIASLVNGITSEKRIAQRFGWERTVLGIAQGMDAVFIGNEMTFSHAGEIRFGAAAGTAPGVVEDLADFYARAGIAHVVEADPLRRMWVKLMLNVGINQTCMAYGGTYGSASEPQSEQNRCFVAAMREALAVAQAEGINVGERDLAQMADLVAGLDPAGMPSMAQDRINKKPTEVEEFSGVIVELARKHGILVPQNRWLQQRIGEIERGYLGQ